MVWTIKLTATAAKQLGKINRTDAKRISKFLRERVAPLEDPRSAGKALTGPKLGSYWRYRVGAYRLICHIQDGALVILVIEVGNRKDIYQ